MPQVFKRKWKAPDGSPKTSSVYYTRFQANGKDYMLSTGKEKKTDALKKMAELIAEQRDQSSVEEYVQRLESALKELPVEEATKHRRTIAIRLLKGLGKKLSLAAVWKTWLASPNKRNPGPKTLEGYAGRWSRFETWASARGIEFLHETTPALAQEYAADLLSSKISMSTYNTHITFLRGLFKTLRLAGGIEENPWLDDLRQESSPENRRNLTTDELKDVCSAARGTMRYLFAIGLYTGMRLGDCVCLRWNEVDFKTGIITVMPLKTRRKKKKVRIPLHPVLVSLLCELRKSSKGEFLFPEERKAYLKSNSELSKRIQKFFTDCGIQTHKEGTGKTEEYKAALKKWIKGGKKGKKPTCPRAVVEVGFHSLRHSFVSLCAANHVPQVAIMELVGHGSPAMTELYSHAGDEQKMKAIAALPSVRFENEAEDD
ncbi:MAG: site-specific integrase [Kiritimatiellales bacterium]